MQNSNQNERENNFYAVNLTILKDTSMRLNVPFLER
jgi:hypothetical protein